MIPPPDLSAKGGPIDTQSSKSGPGMFSLRKLIAAAYPDHPDISSIPESSVAGIECNSRKIRKGFVFVAVRGVHDDGNAYIGEAVERGAAAVISERPGSGAGQAPPLR